MRNPSKLTKLIWKMFGKPDSVRQWELEESARIQAETWGIPYEDHKFWPAYRVFDKSMVAPGISHHVDTNKNICPDLYSASVGDIVMVFRGKGMDFLYRVVGRSWAGGSDHIVSPAQFHIRFVRSSPTP